MIGVAAVLGYPFANTFISMLPRSLQQHISRDALRRQHAAM
jgi:hypothetical protein